MIWKSKEFWTVVLDLVVSAALYFGGRYLAPDAFDDLKWVIAALQPIALFLIAWFATEKVRAEVRFLARMIEGRAEHK